MVWDNTYKVLQEYAVRLRNTYQDKLIKDGKIASGELLNSVEYIIDRDGNSISVSLQLAEYWKWVENGRGPGKFPPIDAIMSWIRIKPIIPDERSGRLPTEKQLAYLIGRKIAEEGIEAGNQLSDTQKELQEEWMRKIEEAITKDVEENVNIIFSQFLIKSD